MPFFSAKTSPLRRFIFRFLKTSLLIVAIGYCAHFFKTNYNIIKDIWKVTTCGSIFFSALLAIMGFSLFPACICELYSGLQNKATGSRATNLVKIQCIYFIANIFKYIPGKVSTLFVFMDEADHQGLNPTTIFQAWLGANGLSFLIGINLAIMVLFPLIKDVAWSILIIILIFILLIMTILPRSNAFLLQRLFSLLGKDSGNIGQSKVQSCLDQGYQK